VLKNSVLIHNFKDNSGMVLFNSAAGACLGLNLPYQRFNDLLANGQLESALDEETYRSLQRFLNID